MRERLRPARALAGLAALAVLLAGCKVDGTLTIRLDDDGSGSVVASVHLDPSAVERLERIGGGPLSERFRVADLRAAGWRVSEWQTAPDGGARLSVRQRFRTPEEAVALVEQLVGDTGLYRDVVVEMEQSAFRDERRVALTADLRQVGVDVAEDRALAARLRESGVDPAAIDLILTAEAIDALSLAAVVETAGRRDAVSVVAGESATAALADEEPRIGHMALAVAAGALGLAGVLLLGVAGGSAWRAPPRRRARRSQTERRGQVGERAEVDDSGGW